MILVTGAPGNVGTEVVRFLQKADAEFRIGAFNVESAREVFGDDIEIVRFDFTQPETFRDAFADVTRLFLVRPPALSNVDRDIAPAVWAAVGAGVEQIVFLSIQGVENNPIVPHHKIEQLVLKTGVIYTFLRASFFMQNLTTTHRDEIRERNEIAVPVGNAKTSFIDARDIAAVACRALTEGGHANQKYTLTGSEALDYDEVADKLSVVLDRSIQYRRPSVFRFIRDQSREGRKFAQVLVMTALYTITRFGNARDVTGDVAQILDRQPITFAEFAHDHADVWR